MRGSGKPLVVITGAAGDIGTALVEALMGDYTVVGLDREGKRARCELIGTDFTSDEKMAAALASLRQRYGTRIAAVVHLAAYFDFTGEENPLYDSVNVEGTRRLLRELQQFEVERLIYSGTMLIHRPGEPGERISEQTPVEPGWAYPRSKAAAEEVIRTEHGRIPYLLLHLAGLYDDRSCVPTLANQIARIYERDFQSHVYPGDTRAGQSFVHREDMIDAFRRAVDRRNTLPPDAVILVGEEEAVGFEALQDLIGTLVHGEEDWATFRVPAPLAQAGAWLQQKAEPLVPDAIDGGKSPFIRPFMVKMAEDHYALDITQAKRLLGWFPRHGIRATLPRIVAALKADPAGWYRKHGITAPYWLASAAQNELDPEAVRADHHAAYERDHRRYVWGHYLNFALAVWLITSPMTLGYTGTWMAASDIASGVLLGILAVLSAYPRLAWARWGGAFVGCWLLMAPLVFWTPSAAVYLGDTLIGMLAIGFAILLPPTPGISPVALQGGPTVPPGWDFSPSTWGQRVPIIALAFVGFFISRHLAAYQLGHIEGVWDPFFAGGTGLKNGSEEVVTSSVSEAFPIPDAGLGAVTYALEIVTGMLGSARRWRTMPWLVVLFGMMIVPLGVVSIGFIIIQPIVIGTWCALCLIGAAAMLVQIPYSLDELVATGQFLLRRKRAGQALLRVFFSGDTDEVPRDSASQTHDRRAEDDLGWRSVLGGGVGLPWNLALCLLIGAWLMFTRVTVGAEGGQANADHVIGSLVLTVSIAALAEVGRMLRWLNVVLGVALLVTTFWFAGTAMAVVSGVLCGAGLIALSVPCGEVRGRYGS